MRAILTMRFFFTALILVALIDCGSGGGGGGGQIASATITLSGDLSIMNTGSTRSFSATVVNGSSSDVTWSVVEPEGGTITQSGVYTASSTPGTFTVRASLKSSPSVYGSLSVPVVIAMGHPPGYSVGVDYHSYGTDFEYSSFITQYNNATVRATVRTQLQGMADRGATLISTRIWLVNEPGGTNFGQAWRATFPLTEQEQANLRLYAQDVAAVQGSGGNRLRLDFCLAYNGAGDFSRGTLETGLGWSSLTPAVFTSRLQATTTRLLNAIKDVTRPDGLKVVDTIYLLGEVMIGYVPNEEWFLKAHYQGFFQEVSQAGLNPSVYFIAADQEQFILNENYTDPEFPILNKHQSMAVVYRSLLFLKDNNLPFPSRIDFSGYLNLPCDFDKDVKRVLDDADAVLPSLGAAQSYGIAETWYFKDPVTRRQLGQAFGKAARDNPKLKRVCFWTTGGSDPTVNPSYPFTIEDFYPPPY